MEMIRICLCRFVKTGLPLPLETLLPLLLYLAAIFSTSEHGINSVCLLKKILPLVPDIALTKPMYSFVKPFLPVFL